jgi:hypothetical protein
MKLQVLDKRRPTDPIENYKIAYVSDQGLDLNGISDNECEEILASDFCDSVPLQSILEGIQMLIKKLRIGGTVVVGGTDLRAFCKAVLGGAIDPLTASHIVHGSNSLSSVEMTTNTMAELGLQVVETHLNGLHYEVKCARGK